MKFSRYYYLYSLIFIFAIPTLFEGYFIYSKINIFNLVSFMIGISTIGTLWDIWATRHGKDDPIWIWQFNKKDILGPTIFGLPIEEYFFYLVAGVYIIFSWECLKSLQDLPVLIYILPLILVWSLFFIGLPYVLGFKHKDRF